MILRRALVSTRRAAAVRFNSSSSSTSSVSGLIRALLAPASLYKPCVVSRSTYSSMNVTAAAKPSSSPAFYATRPHFENGLFINPWSSAGSGFIKFTEILWSRLSGEWKSVKTSPDMMPVITPDFDAPSKDLTAIRATWLGHATYYVQMPSGLRVLFDPVMGKKCAPTYVPGLNRISPAPCKVSDLPGVDAVVISHAHYDHLDSYSIDLVRSHFPDAHYFVPLGVKAWFESKKMFGVTEMDWWEERDISVNGINATIGCLPAQHTANRSLGDTGKTLWASWSVSSQGKVYFAGDTGYRHVPRLPKDQDDYAIDMPSCPAFAEIGEHRGPFDLALIPIGAYSPRWIMSKVHAAPSDSVNMFLDVKARRALAMHFGTFVLTDEPILEPIEKLKAALNWKGLPESGAFDAIQIGQTVEIPVES